MFKTLHDELQGSAISIFDDIIKRLNIIKHIPEHSDILEKIKIIKTKITDYIIKKEDVMIYWVTIRILDDLSLSIYNE